MLYTFNLESDANHMLRFFFFKVLQLLNSLLILTLNKISSASSADPSPSLASSLRREEF